MSSDQPSPNPAYDALAAGPRAPIGEQQQKPSWLAEESYARLQRAALARDVDLARERVEERLKPESVAVEVDTSKADADAMELSMTLLEQGHAKLAPDAQGHVGLVVHSALPTPVLNDVVRTRLNQRLAAAGYAPRMRQGGKLAAIAELEHDVAVCPECRQGKHGNCDGSSWCKSHDALELCPCAQGDHQ